LLDNGYPEFAVTSEHAITVDSLPPLHKDSFDRILIAQSINEGALLLTSDEQVARYEGPVKLV
jgi:PIN domain nuclease of toxin-antitoxin system